MHFTAKAKETLAYLLTLDMPDTVYVEVGASGHISAQCPTQAAVREFRAMFGGGAMWAKEYQPSSKWWIYDTTLPNGIQVHIYACTEAPPTCKAIIEEIEVEEKVPVQWETKMVKKERVRWECGGGEELQS